MTRFQVAPVTSHRREVLGIAIESLGSSPGSVCNQPQSSHITSYLRLCRSKGLLIPPCVNSITIYVYTAPSQLKANIQQAGLF